MPSFSLIALTQSPTMTPLTSEFPITSLKFLTLPVWLWPFTLWTTLYCVLSSVLFLTKGIALSTRQASYISLHFLILYLLMPLSWWTLLSSISILCLIQFVSCKALYLPRVLVKNQIINSSTLLFKKELQSHSSEDAFWSHTNSDV